MTLDAKDVDLIAHLARIQIDAQDIPEYADNLTNILKLVDQMQTVDTENIEPMAHPMDATQKLRADEISETNLRDELMSTAPEQEAGLFLVPKVIE